MSWSVLWQRFRLLTSAFINVDCRDIGVICGNCSSCHLSESCGEPLCDVEAQRWVAVTSQRPRQTAVNPPPKKIIRVEDFMLNKKNKNKKSPQK